jgi:UDP-glucose:(heptosyl)LPS alpha-1,3-glucosyltransferase
MKLAFCLFKYFPFGGLQRDFLEIARLCQQHGHEIEVFTMDWSGPVPKGLKVHTIKIRAVSNHARGSAFAKKLRVLLRKGKFDAIAGFNKMPGLDIYYAADPCYQARARQKYRPKYGFLYWLTPRFRHYVALERATFDPLARTEILLLSDAQRQLFIRYYQTPAERFHLLPPGISKDRRPPDNAAEIRIKVRFEFGLSDDQKLLLTVGSGLRGKGLDRTLRAFAALPPELRQKTRLLVIGQDKSGPFRRIAARLGLGDQVWMLPGREDVPRFLLGADLLIHPAYCENTGTVILEAMVCGLPVLVTDVCGYAVHVARARAGRVLTSPFVQEALNRSLEEMLTSPMRDIWARNGLAYGVTEDLYSRPQMAAAIIEETARARSVKAPADSVAHAASRLVHGLSGKLGMMKNRNALS